MNKEDFNYFLPDELIAQHPPEERGMSRLLCLDGDTGVISHRMFADIKDYLRYGDCLVVNNTRVIPARLLGVRNDTKAPVEVLLLKRLDKNSWEVIVKPGKKMRTGHRVVFIDGVLEGEITGIEESGNRIIRFDFEGIWEEVLDLAGQIPLPPYIHEKLMDKERYQTVYSKYSGSAAAPTAGLHFTNDLLAEIEKLGVSIAEVTLHVGLGTFRPVKESAIENHIMHSEYYEVTKDAADKINNSVTLGGRIIGVGTTSCRVLESVMKDHRKILPTKGDTDIFIYPGYEFKILDALITNFHLPESTLILLVSAFSGTENVRKAYMEAIENRYRFFSFGDAMLLTKKHSQPDTEQQRSTEQQQNTEQ